MNRSYARLKEKQDQINQQKHNYDIVYEQLQEQARLEQQNVHLEDQLTQIQIKAEEKHAEWVDRANECEALKQKLQDLEDLLKIERVHANNMDP